MTTLANEMAAAWADKAQRVGEEFSQIYQHKAFFKPVDVEEFSERYQHCVKWYQYWSVEE